MGPVTRRTGVTRSIAARPMGPRNPRGPARGHPTRGSAAVGPPGALFLGFATFVRFPLALGEGVALLCDKSRPFGLRIIDGARSVGSSLCHVSTRASILLAIAIVGQPC